MQVYCTQIAALMGFLLELAIINFLILHDIIHRRKRLRAVCVEDMPWRAQANLIQAACFLDTLLGRLVGHSASDERATDLEPHLQQPHRLTFDAAGVIIDGVVPIHPPAVAGAEGKVQFV